MRDGERCKDQDDVRWQPTEFAAAIADGVTASPKSKDAARVATALASVILRQCDVRTGINVLRDLLFCERRLFREVVRKAQPWADNPLLAEVVDQQLDESHQCTLSAVQLSAEDNLLCVKLLQCGDSPILAFDGQGRLLMSLGYTGVQEMSLPDGETSYRFASVRDRKIRNQVLKRAGLQAKDAADWYVWSATNVAQLKTSNAARDRSSDQYVVVPRWLRSDGQRPRTLIQSPLVRWVDVETKAAQWCRLPHNGCATLVLPDDADSAAFSHHVLHLPTDTSLVLATDGLIDAFDSAPDLYQWLTRHRAAWHNPSARSQLLSQLHRKLRDRGGDDDISFIWLHPDAEDDH